MQNALAVRDNGFVYRHALTYERFAHGAADCCFHAVNRAGLQLSDSRRTAEIYIIARKKVNKVIKRKDVKLCKELRPFFADAPDILNIHVICALVVQVFHRLFCSAWRAMLSILISVSAPKGEESSIAFPGSFVCR